jgi:hypothetical protein
MLHIYVIKIAFWVLAGCPPYRSRRLPVALCLLADTAGSHLEPSLPTPDPTQVGLPVRPEVHHLIIRNLNGIGLTVEQTQIHYGNELGRS